MTRRRILTLAAVIVACTGLYAGPATALNKPGGGGSCTRWVYYTDAKGWPQYKCISYVYR